MSIAEHPLTAQPAPSPRPKRGALPMRPDRVSDHHYHVTSSTTPGVVYDVTLDDRGLWSCDCPARVDVCRHVALVEDCERARREMTARPTADDLAAVETARNWPLCRVCGEHPAVKDRLECAFCGLRVCYPDPYALLREPDPVPAPTDLSDVRAPLPAWTPDEDDLMQLGQTSAALTLRFVALTFNPRADAAAVREAWENHAAAFEAYLTLCEQRLAEAKNHGAE